MTEIDDVLKSNNEIQKQLLELQNTVSSLKEQSNQDTINIALSEMKKDISYSVASYIQDNLDNEINSSIKHDCSIQEPCKKAFEEILKTNIETLRTDNITPKYKEDMKEKIHKLRMSAPKKECTQCINKMDNLLFNHMKLIETLDKPQNNTEELKEFDENKLVKEILDPLSNKQRIQILKALSKHNQSHSELSKITKLRGGNLIFHLEKLQESGMIQQRHERGDYNITQKGFKLILLLNSMTDLID